MSKAIQNAQVDSRFSFQRENHTGHIILNRTKKLNMMDTGLLKSIFPQIKECEVSKDIHLLVIRNIGKAFIAGADLEELLQNISHKGKEDLQPLREQVDLHFPVVHYVGTMSTPVVTIMDGVVIGGGLFLYGMVPFRIATENTFFSMPETRHGSFVDSSASFIFSRMEGHLGAYLGLTSTALKAEDVLFAGQATHFMHSSQVQALNTALSKLVHPTHEMINEVIERFSAKEDHIPQGYLLTSAVRKIIKKCFRYSTVEEIIHALDRDGSSFALKTKNELMQRPPTSLKLSLEVIRRGAHLSFRDCIEMEYNLWSIVPLQYNFIEGITAFFEKRAPQWKPSKLQDVDLEIDIREKLFGFQNEPRKLVCFNDKDYIVHPFIQFGLPSTEEVLAVKTKYNMQNISEVVSWFLTKHQGKFGIRQRVQQVLEMEQYQRKYGQFLCTFYAWLNDFFF